METLLKDRVHSAVIAAAAAYPASKDPKDWKAFTETLVGDTLFLSFPGTCTWRSEDLLADLAFTTAGVDQSSFPGLGGAQVHEGFLQRFQHVAAVLQTKDFLGTHPHLKHVVLSGHSLGGAVAILATVSLLARQLSAEQALPGQLQVGCVTFGAPLVGSEFLEDTVHSRGWSSHFLHIVGRQDVVPRLLLDKTQGLRRLGNSFLSGQTAEHSALVNHTNPDELSDVSKGSGPGQNALSLREKVRGLFGLVTGGAKAVGKGMLPRAWGNYANDYRTFGHLIIVQEGSNAALFETSNSSEALLALFVTCASDTNPSGASDAALKQHSLNGYSDNVAKLNFAAPKSESTAAATQEARTIWELLITKSIAALLREVEQLHARDRTPAGPLMTRWVEDIEPLSDLLELWTNAFHDPQRAYHAFRCSPVEGEGSNEDVNQARRSIMHFWNDVMREQGPDAIRNLNPDLLQRGQTWRRKFEMLDIANYYRRKLWTEYVEGQGHYLESDNRPEAYVKLEQLEQLAPPNRRHVDSAAFAHQEQTAIQTAKSVLDQLLQAARDREASPQRDHTEGLKAAGQRALQAVQACILPKTEQRLRQLLLDYSLEPQLPGQMQQPAQPDLPAAVEGVIKQFWDPLCENGPPTH